MIDENHQKNKVTQKQNFHSEKHNNKEKQR